MFEVDKELGIIGDKYEKVYVSSGVVFWKVFFWV